MDLSDHQTRMLLLLVGTAAVPLIIARVSQRAETKDLAYGLTNVGLVGTLIGVGLGMVIVPKLPIWASALVLTLAGVGVKTLMLPHVEEQGLSAHPLAEDLAWTF